MNSFICISIFIFKATNEVDNTDFYQPPSSAVNQITAAYKSHDVLGLDEKTVFCIWDAVLSFSQKKVHKEEQGRSGEATRRGQRVSAVQVRQKVGTHREKPPKPRQTFGIYGSFKIK